MPRIIKIIDRIIFLRIHFVLQMNGIFYCGLWFEVTAEETGATQREKVTK